MRATIFTGLKRLAWILPLIATAAATTPVIGCSDITGGDKCKTGCPCGAACISCKDTCHKGTDYQLLTGAR